MEYKSLHKERTMTPERRLAYSIIIDSIKDLKKNDKEAKRFLFDTNGSWSIMRQFWLIIAGIRPDWLARKLREGKFENKLP